MSPLRLRSAGKNRVPASSFGRRVAGFTTAELMVVISVLGILMVLSIPAFVKRNTRQKLDIATSMISTQVQLARQKAVSKRMRYRIEMNYSTNKFRVLRREADGTWTEDPPGNLYALPIETILSAESTPADGIFDFEPRGTVDLADLPVTLKLKDRDGTMKSVQVARSGMIQEFPNW